MSKYRYMVARSYTDGCTAKSEELKNAFREGYETLTIMYKDGMKVTIAASEYAALKSAWEARRNGR